MVAWLLMNVNTNSQLLNVEGKKPSQLTTDKITKELLEGVISPSDFMDKLLSGGEMDYDLNSDFSEEGEGDSTEDSDEKMDVDYSSD